MKKESSKGGSNDRRESEPYRVRLPGFITNEDLGLGDVIKRATRTIGIKTCNACARRALRLNRWMVFSGRR